MIHSDFHVHTSFSSDSDTPARAQIEALIQKDITDICITDHEDIGYPQGLFLLDPFAYYDTIAKLAPAYASRARVAVGIELGLRTDYRQDIEAFAHSRPWEFIIGSTHVVDGADPYYPEYWKGRTKYEGILQYYSNTLDNIKMFDCFDVYGHLDYIIRYAPGQSEGYKSSDYQDILDEILRLLISKGKGLECNTAGLKYGLSHTNPDDFILKRYRELGGEILTIGSDGHKPEHVAYDFARLPSLLKDCGFSYYTVFHNRRPLMLPL